MPRAQNRRMVSLDSETTGVDFYHGARPFFVTTCDDEGTQRYWEWDVDPVTRQPKILKEDIAEIVQVIEEADLLVLQNPKFDVTALEMIGIKDWPWHKTHDTLLAGHLLGSNLRHDLTSMAIQYLGRDISPYERALGDACKEARKIAGRMFPKWRLAKKGLPDMPSAKGDSDKGEKGVESEKPWRFDMWLPRALAKRLKYPDDHPWWTATSEYSNTDSAITLPLFLVMMAEMERQGLWRIYRERLKVLPIAHAMESRGVTVSKVRLDELRDEYTEGIDRAAKVCTNIAAGMGYDLKLPKGASPNNSLRSFCYDVLKLPPVYDKKSKTDSPTLNKDAMAHYLATLPRGEMGYTFIKTLLGKRSRDTAVTYMNGYEKFWQPIIRYDSCSCKFCGGQDTDAVDHRGSWFVLHPSLNPTGTDTLRWSSSNPNEQNISKKENFNLRYCFGPAPGREWWSCDAKNLELRIPAYESGEKMMVDLFERAAEPPYFGSYHLLIFDIFHPDKFAKHGAKCKDVYESTWYQWTKNGNFAVTYGAVEESGTADRAYHVPGAQRLIKERLRDLTQLNNSWVAYANKHGYVETIPDKEVCPERGYPLLCTRSKWGNIKPTVPFNYHVQGTAMWWMARAMVACQAKLDEWNEDGFDGHICLQVHDELVFDFPKCPRSVEEQVKNKWRLQGDTLWRVRILQKLMERCGDAIGVPTPVSAEYHAESWDKGVSV